MTLACGDSAVFALFVASANISPQLHLTIDLTSWRCGHLANSMMTSLQQSEGAIPVLV